MFSSRRTAKTPQLVVFVLVFIAFRFDPGRGRAARKRSGAGPRDPVQARAGQGARSAQGAKKPAFSAGWCCGNNDNPVVAVLGAILYTSLSIAVALGGGGGGG